MSSPAPADDARVEAPPAPRPRRKRRWLRAVLALVLGCAVSALLAEGFVRLFIGEQAKFPRRVVEASWGLRYNDPGATYRHRSPDVDVEFRINRQGMRSPRDFAYAKPEGVKRIVSLGDSFTVGYEVSEQETFSAVLERELNASGRRVEVLNAGVSGFSNAEQCLYLERELWKYEPDVVLVSFFANDLEDNLRTGLFALGEDGLVATADRYVPGGGLANFLNSNPVFNFLSERSDAFVFAKERTTRALKRRMVEENIEAAARLQPVGAPNPPDGGGTAPREGAVTVRLSYAERLSASILERLCESAAARDVPVMIQSIPALRHGPPRVLVDAFPYVAFQPARGRVATLSAKVVLEPHLGTELLYWTRSHGHWTPFAHDVAGRALRDAILARGFLE